MASLAAGGGVGPHVDSSDVFLVQARGSRRWSVELGFVDEAEERRRTRTPTAAAGRSRTFARRRGRWKPATCSTCRRDCPTTASPWGRRLLDLLLRAADLRAAALAWRWADEALAPAATVGVLADPAWDPADGATVPAAALATAKDAVRAAVDARLADGDGFAAWFGGLVTAPRADAPDDAAPARTGTTRSRRASAATSSPSTTPTPSPTPRARASRVPASGVLLCANGSCRRLDPALGDLLGASRRPRPSTSPTSARTSTRRRSAVVALVEGTLRADGGVG
ncbi:hypothetical protein JL720_14986 [Aureococcus anophagefferens]|nr:hypothetical protein JL720_14986 [Aureococcus anophagefferens]